MFSAFSSNESSLSTAKGLFKTSVGLILNVAGRLAFKRRRVVRLSDLPGGLERDIDCRLEGRRQPDFEARWRRELDMIYHR